MYIKRTPLGQGNLSFKRRKARYPLILIILYLGIMGSAIYALANASVLQPQVSAMIGPPPTPTSLPEIVIKQAEDAYHAGDLAKAAEYYQLAVQIQPENIDVLTQYARILTMNHKLDEAIAVADQAIALAPDDPRGHAMRARALDWKGQYQDSVLSSLKSIELDNNYAPAHAYLAEAYADLGRLRQGREQAEMAIELDPYNVDARRNYAYILEFYGDYQGAVQQYIQAKQLEPNLLELWYGLARNLRGARDYEQSIANFTEIAQRTPKDPQVYIELGKTYFEIREDDAAQDAFETAVSLVCSDCPLYTSKEILDSKTPFFNQPRNHPQMIYISAWNRLGQVYFTRRNYESAIAILEEAVACGEQSACINYDTGKMLTPDNVPIESYYVLASAYYYLDRCEIAVPRAKQALQLYVDRKTEDPTALKNVLSVFVLCRDYAGKPYVTTGAGFTNGFPDGYEEPEVLIQKPGSNTSSGTATP